MKRRVRPSEQCGCRSRPLAAALVGALAAGALLAAGAAPAAPGGPELTASVTPAELTIGASTTLSGRLLAAPGPATPLVLQGEPYPSRGFITVARTTAAPDGSFSFVGLQPDRNTRMRVLAETQPATLGRELLVTVDPRVVLSSHSLGRGRTLLSVRVRHAPLAGAASVSASWFVQARGSSVFRLAAVTATRERAGGVMYASAIVDPPSRHFAYRVCMNPSWEHVMGPHATHGRCPTHDFVLRAGDEH